MFHVLRALAKRTGLRKLCLAGGCAMNSVANGKFREQTEFEEVFIQPAAGDDGTALGAAFFVWHELHRKPRRFRMEHAYWGPDFQDAEVAAILDGRRAELRGKSHIERLDDLDPVVDWAVSRIAVGQVVGWFQGRMEWGARALGNRSILADPRRGDMRRTINRRIKHREKFRPFAPAVLAESLGEFFVGAVPDPFMIHVYPVRPDRRESIPAVTHVDGSARLQTVHRDTNPVFHRLIARFGEKTGVPVLLNTSFNENEPIVYRPEEALDCFLRTDMDALVLGNHVLEKTGAREGARSSVSASIAVSQGE